MATIKDIARKAGVSISTVSHALNATRYVKKETIERIMGVAKECNYQPSGIARAMRTKYTKYIGFFIPKLDNPFYYELFEGMNDYANDNGYFIVIFSSNDEDHTRKQEFFASIISRGIDGLVISGIEGHEKDKELLQNFIEKNVPVILVNRYIRDLHLKPKLTNVQSIITNNFEGGRIAATYLNSLGHTRVGFISSDLKIKIFNDRYRGFQSVAKEKGMTEEFCIDMPFPMSDDLDVSFMENMGLIRKSTAVFVASDWIAIRLIFFLRQNSIEVPEDISVIGFDNIKLSQIIEPKLTTVSQNVFRMGELAVQKLFQKIKNKRDQADRNEKKIILLEPNLIERNSVVRVDS